MADDETRPYLHLHPPKKLDTGGIHVKVRASDGRIIGITVPKRNSTAPKIHEAVMAAIESQPRKVPPS